MNASIEVDGSGVPDGSANAAEEQEMGTTAEPTASATKRNTNKEQVMSTSDSSTSDTTAEPTASAKPSSPDKEQVMSTRSPNPDPSSGTATESPKSGSTSEEPASTAPADSSGGSADDGEKKPSNAESRFVPTKILEAGDKRIDEAAGNTNPVIIGDVRRVKACQEPMWGLAAVVRSTSDASRAKFDAWKADETKLDAVAKPLLWSLRHTDGGRAFAKGSKATSLTVRMANVLAGLAEEGFAVPTGLLQDVKTALAVAQGSKAAYDAAEKARVTAVENYASGKQALQSAISALIAAINHEKFSARAGEGAVQPVTPPPPPPPELNGSAPAPVTKAASKSAKRKGVNGVHGADR